ncbi:MAG: GNAT family N-acetyltransferase [Gammaproteobacteria bacterium]|nr:GNAT family N-acetyltransferase [Gammaproteobacteria bacterium]
MPTLTPDSLMAQGRLVFLPVDPCCEHALGLLHEAAIEARALYPDLHSPDAPWPTNQPTPPGGIYLLAYLDAEPVACGALRPLDRHAVEIRRMYVLKSARRQGLARVLLRVLEQAAAGLGYTVMRLETGRRQAPAISLYLACGFVSIPPFGEYKSDPVSRCFEKPVALNSGSRFPID